VLDYQAAVKTKEHHEITTSATFRPPPHPTSCGPTPRIYSSFAAGNGREAGMSTRRKAAVEPSAWARRAAELARWAWDRYVVRDDVWGGYIPLDLRDKEMARPDGSTYKLGATCTRPARSKRGLIKLTLGVLEQHFRATLPEHVAGIHTTSPENYSKFGTVEIDWHGPDSSSPETNWRAAQGWYDALVLKQAKIPSPQGIYPLVDDDASSPSCPRTGS
jgi:hypothetical protein